MLRLENINRIYCDDDGNEITALENISVEFPNRGLIVINGTSGCGKTTLLNLLGGLDRPTKGSLFLDDVRIDDNSEKWWDLYRGSSLGFVYQDFNLIENMNVRDNIKLPLELRDVCEDDKNEKLEQVIEELGLKDLEDKKTAKLSGGQKQRVAIARALVTGAKILLADEPTGNLDKDNSEKVFKILKEIAKDRLVIVVTHDAILARQYADRLISISYGNIESDESIDEFVRNQEVHIANDSESESRFSKTISTKMRLNFAKEAMYKRKMRCIVSILIFSITMIFILLLSEFIFRKDDEQISKYLLKTEYKISSIYMNVDSEYSSVTESTEIFYGKKFYELLCEKIDKSRIIRLGKTYGVEFVEGEIENPTNIIVHTKNKKYFTYEGKFPETGYEIAISKGLAERLGKTSEIIGDEFYINGERYTVCGVITHICGRDITEVYVEDESEDNIFDEIIFTTEDTLFNASTTRNIYMSGFGVVTQSNLFYQLTLYNDVGSVGDIESIVSGRVPENRNEILISQSYLENMDKREADFIGKTYKITDLYQNKYGCSFWNMINIYDYLGDTIKIVGVADGTAEFFICEDVYNELYKEDLLYYDRPYFILVDEECVKEDINSLHSSNVKISDKSLRRMYEFIENIDKVKSVIIVICIVMIVLTILQMISLFSYSISDNKKTIGILRTLGVGKKDTMKIFMIESLIVSIVSYTIAIVVSVVLTEVINNYIGNVVFENIELRFLSVRTVIIVIVGMINCLISLISVLVPIRRYSKKKIIELIK